MKLVNLIVLALVTSAAAIASGLAQEAAPDPLTSAKLAADLGDGAEAERLLTSVAEDAGAPAARRGEALVRLGALRRGRGDTASANEAFRAALARGGSDASVLALLARSVEGVSASEDILRAALGKALLTEDAGRLQLDLGGSDASSACALDSVTPVTLSLQDSDLADAAWLITEAAGIPVVLSPCLDSTARRVSIDFVALPAGQALSALQRMQGLRCARQGKVLIIGCADAAPMPASTCVAAAAEPISISVRGVDGGTMMGLFTALLGMPVLAQDCVQARTVSMQLSDVPASDVICALARAQGWNVEVKDEGLRLTCAGDASVAAVVKDAGSMLGDVIASLAHDAGRHVVVSPEVRTANVTRPPGEPAAALATLLATHELVAVDCGGVSVVVPTSQKDAASAPAGVPADFPSTPIDLRGNQAGLVWFARALARETGRLLIPGCRRPEGNTSISAGAMPAGTLLDAWCRAQGLKLRASGPVLFAWGPACDGPTGVFTRASMRDGKIDLAVKDVLVPQIVAAMNLLADKPIYADVHFRERVLSLDGTWNSTGDAARALAAALGTQATWSETRTAWLIGPPEAILLGNGFRRYVVNAESMPLGAWLDLVRPVALWPVTVAEGVDLARSVPLSDLRADIYSTELIESLEQRTPYHVDWDDKGLVIRAGAAP